MANDQYLQYIKESLDRIEHLLNGPEGIVTRLDRVEQFIWWTKWIGGGIAGLAGLVVIHHFWGVN
jgi:hypothetical protein